MDKRKWINKLSLPLKSDILFYQNPDIFRTNSFKRESLISEADTILRKTGKINLFTITGIINSHHKNEGTRIKVCLVREYLQ